MKRYLFVLILGVLFFGSCSSGDEPEPAPGPQLQLDSDKAYISFRMAMTGSDGSRGMNPGQYPGNGYWGVIDPAREGTEMESRIQRPLFASIYDKTNDSGTLRCLARVTDLQYAGTTIYGVITLNPGFTIDDIRNNNVRLMVYANFSGADEQRLYGSDLSAQNSGVGGETFTRHGTAAAVGVIPAWGVAPFDRPDIGKGRCINFGEVKLLRAMNKIRVEFNLPADQRAATTFHGLTLYNAATSGRYVPENWWHRWQTIDTEHIEIYEDAGAANLTEEYAAVDNVVEFYVPECNNPRNGMDEVRMRLKYTVSGDYRESDIYVRRYDDNGRITDTIYNLARNNYYHYEVTSVSMDKIKLTAYVNDWAWRGDLGSEIIF